MKLRFTLFVTLCAIVIHCQQASADPLAGEKVKVAPIIPRKAHAFPLRDVRLLDGPFKHAMEMDRQYLLSLEVDRLLHTFRLNAGIPSSARPLGGWEEPKGELRGHFIGHYLTACALMYASTGDEQIRKNAAAVVAGLAECQAKLGSGYLSAYPEEFFDRVEARQRVWAPYYTLHKIYAGLLDMYIYCDDAQALEVCKKFADWVIARNGKLSEAQMQRMLGEEHGGMNEVLANLYGITGEAKYLAVSKRFNHMAVIGPAMQRQDRLTGQHANTQVPKFIGTARQYELTGEEPLKAASLFFWNTVVKERSYVIGGHSDGEMFSPKERLSTAFGPSTTETCNTYNMLKLTRHLFAWDPRAEYADYYERALYNHILASQDPKTGGMCYYVPLRPGSHKTYGGPFNSFWCCTGTGVENHAKYGDSIYFNDGGKGLFVNLFIASELSWKDRGMKLRQETSFPDEQASRLTIACEQPTELTIHIRHPAWATTGFQVSVNGENTVASKPGEYASITRTWKSGDVIQVRLPFELRKEGFADNANRFAFLHGPVVLAAEVDTKKPIPAIVAENRELLTSLKPVEGKPSTFTSDIFRIPGQSGTTVTLEPFFKIHGGRSYTVYWDAFTPEQWTTKQAEYQAELAKQKELEAKTIDHILPANDQNERDHKVTGERTSAGRFGDRGFRHATDGGWFEWQIKVLPDVPQELRITYWGSDGNRTFDILVDGVKLTTQRLTSKQPGKFYDEVHALPADMIKGKERITVRFQAHAGSWAGGVFGVRVMRAE